ncbi:archaellin/type IV pilin N-terminal domain-containing protein [Pyrodictium abyssi]|uniref:Uncharacterized protein n=1 Tax=Pyrodictium abyssi TaxID=54256 RepID=A0ABM8IXQ5_9CREN|nr:hypothetical protein PABY_05200 [Pyrodictium abyssi]
MKSLLRGVSPVVATALLVLIAVATAALLYLWVSGVVQSMPQNSYQMQEQIKIDAVQYEVNGNTYNFTIYVRNVGDIKTKIASAYVINSNNTVAAANTTVNVQLAPGAVDEVLVANVPAGKLSEVVQVKVVTENGVEASYVVTLR